MQQFRQQNALEVRKQQCMAPTKEGRGCTNPRTNLAHQRHTRSCKPMFHVRNTRVYLQPGDLLHARPLSTCTQAHKCGHTAHFRITAYLTSAAVGTDLYMLNRVTCMPRRTSRGFIWGGPNTIVRMVLIEQQEVSSHPSSK